MNDNPRPDGPDHPDVSGVSDVANSDVVGSGIHDVPDVAEGRAHGGSNARILLNAARRWVLPVAVPAAIALAIAAGVDFINGHAPSPSGAAGKKSGRHQPGAGADGPARDTAAPALMTKGRPLPRYLVGVRRSGSAVVVRDVRTLANVAEVKAPAKRRFKQVAAAGLGARSYVVSTSAGGGIAFYRLRVGADGRPGPLTPLPRIWIPGTSTTSSDMAINERGDTIAYVSYGSHPGGSAKIAIDVVSTAGGARRTWTTSLTGRIGGLSWAGRTLSFVWAPMRGKAVVRHQVRTLDTTQPAGDLKVSRPVLTLPDGADTAVMSLDGSMVVTGVAAPTGLELAAYSAADGRRTKVLWRRPGAPPRVVKLVPDIASGDLIAKAADGRLLVAPAHGATGFAAAADLADVAW